MSRRSLLSLCAGLAALNLALNSAQYVGYQEGPVRFDAEVGRLARSLLTGGAFADPFGAGPTGPSAHTPPLFPTLYAAYVALLGESTRAWVAIKLAGGLVLSLWIGLLPMVSQGWGMGAWPGCLGALLAIGAALRHFPEWDANYTALVCVVLAIVAAPRIWEPLDEDVPGTVGGVQASAGRGGTTMAVRRLAAEALPRDVVGVTTADSANWVGQKRDAALGLLWSVGMHLNAAMLLLFMAWAAALVWRHRRLRVAIPWAALVIPLVLLLPWTMRNWVVVGSPIVLRGNLGLELAVANNDCARAGLLQNLASGCFARTHPDESPVEAARLQAMGEPAYHAARFAEARAWIGDNPACFVSLTARRLMLFWFPSPLDDLGRDWWESTPPRRARVVWIATVLMLVGLVQLARRSLVQAATLGATLLLVSALYYPVQFEDRYRYPILWVAFLMAGSAIVDVAARLQRIATRARG